MKLSDRLCVAVGVGVAVWGMMLHVQTVAEARIIIPHDDDGIRTAWTIGRNGSRWEVAGGLLLAAWGLTGAAGLAAATQRPPGPRQPSAVA